MQLLIRFLDGPLRSAFLMAIIGSRLRVALPDCGDIAEYRLAHGQWLDEYGEPVEIDFDPTEEEFERYAQPLVKGGQTADGALCCPIAAPLPACPAFVN